MRYIKVTFLITGEPESEMLMAMLADAGYDGFEETENELLAYIEELKFHEDELTALAGASGMTYRTEIIPAQNWNALWESNFEPVVVKDFCTIRAHFHDINTDTPYNITITPKMSFGTGHHATTQQMIMLMKDIPFAGCSVLDFGTGTGVLAILAEMLGAKQVLAIDNDEWSVENARENIERNYCKNIIVEKGSLEDIPLM
ncbi:MAG: 50S ribosomal protein L11 methyltransferase, partial [Chitinophagales bacterium]